MTRPMKRAPRAALLLTSLLTTLTATLMVTSLTGCVDGPAGHHGSPPQDPADYHGVPTDTRPPTIVPAPNAQ
jgi:hypothetical protein